jgi:hypothetical protein
MIVEKKIQNEIALSRFGHVRLSLIPSRRGPYVPNQPRRDLPAHFEAEPLGLTRRF